MKRRTSYLIARMDKGMYLACHHFIAGWWTNPSTLSERLTGPWQYLRHFVSAHGRVA